MSPSELTSADVKQMAKLLDLHVPVIVITAHDEPGTAERVGSLGAAAYLKKPVDRDTLLAAIEAATSSHAGLLALAAPDP